jgi:hypothetical protein
MKNFKSKIAGICISLFLGAIIMSFVLTGFSGFSLNGNKVASVGDTNITRQEYSRALSSQLNQFTQARQGKSLSEKEIRTFGIRERVLDQLINQKLLLNYATELGFDAGKKSIKDSMQQIYPFFFNNGKFDVNKYKTALRNNRLSPSDFEKDLISQSKVITLNKLFAGNVISNKFAEEMFKLKNEKAKVLAVSFDKEAMTQNLKISGSEVNTFIADKKNEATLSSLFKSYELENAKKAKKFDSVKKELAVKHLQRTKRKELKAFNDKLQSDLSTMLSKNQIGKIKALVKKYGIKFSNKKEMSLINTNVEGMSFNQDKVTPIFNSKDTKAVITEDTATKVSLLRAVSFSFKKPTKEEIKKEIEFDQYKRSGIMSNDIVKFQKLKSKIVKAALLQ